MKVVRSLERRLEKMMDGVAGRFFSGRLHPTELAGKVAREADFARFEHESGPGTANRYIIEVNPKDLAVDGDGLSTMLRDEIVDYTTDEGLRLEGPITVDIKADGSTPPGTATIHCEIAPAPQAPWARLLGEQTFDITHNRSLIGRADDMDVIIYDPSVSRRHALIWRENGQSWLQDIGSSNGTNLDGGTVESDPIALTSGSAITFGSVRFRFKGI